MTARRLLSAPLSEPGAYEHSQTVFSDMRGVLADGNAVGTPGSESAQLALDVPREAPVWA